MFATANPSVQAGVDDGKQSSDSNRPLYTDCGGLTLATDNVTHVPVLNTDLKNDPQAGVILDASPAVYSTPDEADEDNLYSCINNEDDQMDYEPVEFPNPQESSEAHDLSSDSDLYEDINTWPVPPPECVGLPPAHPSTSNAEGDQVHTETQPSVHGGPC